MPTMSRISPFRVIIVVARMPTTRRSSCRWLQRSVQPSAGPFSSGGGHFPTSDSVIARMSLTCLVAFSASPLYRSVHSPNTTERVAVE